MTPKDIPARGPNPTLDDISRSIGPSCLFVMGTLAHPTSPEQTIVLIGADHSMWPVFTLSPEYTDTARNPLDRWSKRIIGALATTLKAEAVYPSDGPPYAPFISWALASGQFFQSPTGMMVHVKAGLMISIRAALILDQAIDPDKPAANPCDSCATKPCVTACPVDALSNQHFYDVATCKAYLRSTAGADCMNHGCKTRTACPVSQSFNRNPAQSAFHMRAFTGV
ncbi:ferredoxin [Sulfitobacter sp. SK012]|uniref:ferredoxin n=1 Tax=Sulfitobacter sp. SK012 TaxID=1389005 RepID=UPI000E0CA25A|nr:ferredoxin [Sulfitobacter sp. SK012]AXI45177.1 ferredoxin [Sulfitobacter sp. SK012]